MQKFNAVAATIVGTTLSLGLAAGMPAAHAVSLIPQKEGEIKLTNLECVASTCIDTSTELGYKVTSLEYGADKDGKKYSLSRLFVDQRNTENNWGFGIKFGKKDAGTNTVENQYWLRPVAYGTDGKTIEDGQLEVGRFLIEFDPTLSDVTLDFFDVEVSSLSGILEVNGQSVNNLLQAGPNDGTQSLTVNNVKTLLVQLGGQKVGFSTGDGVSLSGVRSSGVAIPEPGNVISLGALAVAGMFGLRRRKKVSHLG